MKYFVEILDCMTLEVVERLECNGGERDAQRMQDGVNINLNHDAYFTRITKGESDNE